MPFGALTVTDLANGKKATAQPAVRITRTPTGTAARLDGAAMRLMVGPSAHVISWGCYTDSTRLQTLGSTLENGVLMAAHGIEQAVPRYARTMAAQAIKVTGTYRQALALAVEI